ncbi:hypothetical protein TNCV_5132211 [Trichonephila clavipes]|nr:hypothetical protein TNCV_5132211 [Trichonephila clavipes]
MASESCFYTREKQEVAFDWLEREAERDFGGAMKDNRVEPFCTQDSKIVCRASGWHNHGVVHLPDHTLSSLVDKSMEPKRLAWRYDKLSR